LVTEFRKFDLTICIHKHVLAAQVSVANILDMQKLEACEYLVQNVGAKFLVNVALAFPLLDDLLEVADVHVLVKHPNFGAEVVCLNAPQD
jgi:hypothetical protein